MLRQTNLSVTQNRTYTRMHRRTKIRCNESSRVFRVIRPLSYPAFREEYQSGSCTMSLHMLTKVLVRRSRRISNLIHLQPS